MMAGCNAALITVENDVKPGFKIPLLLRPTIIVVRSHTGDFAGSAANTARGIGHNKSIHLLPFYYFVISSRVAMQYSDTFLVLCGGCVFFAI